MDLFLELLFITTLAIIILVAAILAFKQRLGEIRANILLVILAILLITSTVIAYLTERSKYHYNEVPDKIFSAFQDIACYDFMLICIIALYLIVKIVHSRG